MERPDTGNAFRELTDGEYAALDFQTVRCTTCTPCCMGHTHFLYRGSVLWACREKIRNRESERGPSSRENGKDAS